MWGPHPCLGEAQLWFVWLDVNLGQHEAEGGESDFLSYLWKWARHTAPFSLRMLTLTRLRRPELRIAWTQQTAELCPLKPGLTPERAKLLGPPMAVHTSNVTGDAFLELEEGHDSVPWHGKDTCLSSQLVPKSHWGKATSSSNTESSLHSFQRCFLSCFSILHFPIPPALLNAQ